MRKFDYFQPESLKEAMDLKGEYGEKGIFIAGGTDIIPRIKGGGIAPRALISLGCIEELGSFSTDPDLVMGGMTRFRDIERDRVIEKRYPALFRAVSVLANQQIRNVATVGGNICNASPCADSVPPLMVMGAKLTLVGPKGERRLPLDSFFTGPGENALLPDEILKEINVPPQNGSSASAFFKIGRVAQDISVVNAAAMVEITGNTIVKCRLGAGSVGPSPLRLKRAEKLAEGQPLTDELLEEVAKAVEKEVSPITDVRSTEEHRRTVAGVLIKRAIKSAGDRLLK